MWMSAERGVAEAERLERLVTIPVPQPCHGGKKTSMTCTRVHPYRGFSVTVISVEIEAAGLPPARQFEGRFAVASEGANAVAWQESGGFVFDTRVHAATNARRAARRSVDRYLLLRVP